MKKKAMSVRRKIDVYSVLVIDEEGEEVFTGDGEDAQKWVEDEGKKFFSSHIEKDSVKVEKDSIWQIGISPVNYRHIWFECAKGEEPILISTVDDLLEWLPKFNFCKCNSIGKEVK